MSGKNIIFNNEKINKNKFYKKNHMVQKSHLNTSLALMIMMSLDHYV